RVEQLAALRLRLDRASRGEGVRDAMVDVGFEQLLRDRGAGGGGGGDLRQHVDAVPVVLDHPRDPANLALDPRESPADRGLVVRVARSRRHHRRTIADTPWGYGRAILAG